MKKDFYIFRHGLATKSLDGYGDQVLTAGILEEGIPAIEKLAKFLKDIRTDENYTSKVPRCLETSAIVSGITGKIFIPDERLSEFYNETIEQLVNRVKSFLSDIQKIPGNSIAIATHGAIIAVLIHLISEGHFDESKIYDFPHPAGLVIIKNGNIQMINFDDI